MCHSPECVRVCFFQCGVMFLFVCHGDGGVTACFGRRSYDSPRWQDDMVLKQMVPAENMNAAMPLDGTRNLFSLYFS